MLKFESIMRVYGLTAIKINKKTSFKNEDFYAWEVKGLSKNGLLRLFTPKQILNIYYSGI